MLFKVKVNVYEDNVRSGKSIFTFKRIFVLFIWWVGEFTKTSLVTTLADLDSFYHLEGKFNYI